MKKTLSNLFLSTLAVSSLILASCDNNEDPTSGNPVLTITSDDTVYISGDGGTCYLTYSLVNPAKYGAVSGSSDADWITNFDSSQAGAVSFVASKNLTTSSRSATVTISYAYSTDGSYATVTDDIAIVQDGQVLAPSLTVKPLEITVTYEGGTLSFSYNVVNPADDGTLSCSADADWISGFDYSADGVVGFTVDENTDDDARTATITATYSWSGSAISAEVKVTQDHPKNNNGNDGDDEIDERLSELIGTYTAYGTVYGQGYTYTETKWSFSIYRYSGSGDYDLYIDGCVPFMAGFIYTYGDDRASVGAYYKDGQIVIPAQMTNCSMSTTLGSSYYLGYVICLETYEDNSFSFDRTSSVTLTYNSTTGSWESDYGIILEGFESNSITSTNHHLQLVYPPFTITKN